MIKAQIPALLKELRGHVEQGDRVKLDGKVIAGGVGLTAGLYGETLRGVEARAAKKWAIVEKKINAGGWKTVEAFYYRPNGRCVGKWIRAVGWTLED